MKAAIKAVAELLPVFNQVVVSTTKLRVLVVNTVYLWCFDFVFFHLSLLYKLKIVCLNNMLDLIKC